LLSTAWKIICQRNIDQIGAWKMDNEILELPPHLGIPGQIWGTRYSDGWTIYAYNFGYVVGELTLDQATNVIAALIAALKTNTRARSL
jgi:hypothetical protein